MPHQTKNNVMHAIYLNDQKLSLRADYPKPVPERGEALIRVILAGICATDLELVKGYYPFQGVLGHEFVGVVTQCEQTEWLGRRVVGSINISDCGGKCGLRCPEHCPQRKVLGIVAKDGAFADYVTLPIANLFPVPDAVSDEQAVFTEPLAAAFRITEQVAVKGRQIAVIGPGRLGMLVAQLLRHAGATVTTIGRSTSSLKLPKDMGFPTLYSDSPSLPTFDLVVETTASPEGLVLAVSLVRPNGTIILKSTYAESAELPRFSPIAQLFAKIVVNEITLIGSRCGPFAPALDLLAHNAIQTDPLVEKTYPLTQALAAFEHAAQKGVRKILLKPS